MGNKRDSRRKRLSGPGKAFKRRLALNRLG